MSIGTPLATSLDPTSEAFRSNQAAMQALWDEVATELASVPGIGGQRYVDRHRRRGKLLVRERIERLLDPGYRAELVDALARAIAAYAARFEPAPAETESETEAAEGGEPGAGPRASEAAASEAGGAEP